MERAIYIFLTKSNSPIARMVRRHLPGEWSHSALSLDADLFQMYSFGARRLYNPFDTGFKHESIFGGAYPAHREIEVCILRVPVTSVQLAAVHEQLQRFWEAYDDMRFNMKGLFLSAKQQGAEIKNRFFCSEFVYYVLRESGIVDFKIPRNLVTPNSFLKLSHCVPIYHGALGPLQDSITAQCGYALAEQTIVSQKG